MTQTCLRRWVTVILVYRQRHNLGRKSHSNSYHLNHLQHLTTVLAVTPAAAIAQRLHALIGTIAGCLNFLNSYEITIL